MSDLRNSAIWLSEQIAAARGAVKTLSAPQLGNSSIESGKVEEYDVDGTLVSVVGEQFDGTHTAATLAGPVPPEPTPPTVNPAPGQAEVRWNGKFANDIMSPMDFSHVAVHASREDIFDPDSTTQRATISGESGDTATVLLDPGGWTFLLVAVSQAGKWSDPSDPVTIEITDTMSALEVQDMLLGLDTDLAAVQTSVNGKNTITNSTADADPATPGQADGDRWQKWSTLADGGKLLASWRWSGSVWIPEVMDPTYLPLIDIGAGTFGTLNGGRLAANSVTANSLSATAIDGKTITGASIVGGQVTTTSTPGAVTARMGPTAVWDPVNNNQSLPGIGFAVVGSASNAGGTYSRTGSDVTVTQGGPGGANGGARLELGVTQDQATLYGYAKAAVTGRGGVDIDAQAGTLNLNGSNVSVNGAPMGLHGSYTPVLTATSTAPNIGSGVATGSYNVNGKQMMVEFFIPFGTGGSIGSGNYIVSLPPGFSYGGLGSAIPRGVFMAHLNSTSDISGYLRQVSANSASVYLYWQSALTTVAQVSSATVAWANGSYITGTIHVTIA